MQEVNSTLRREWLSQLLLPKYMHLLFVRYNWYVIHKLDSTQYSYYYNTGMIILLGNPCRLQQITAFWDFTQGVSSNDFGEVQSYIGVIKGNTQNYVHVYKSSNQYGYACMHGESMRCTIKYMWYTYHTHRMTPSICTNITALHKECELLNVSFIYM